MRTTVTLDDEFAAALQRLARERSTSLTEVLTATVRTGLRQPTGGGPYEMPSRRMGLRSGMDDPAGPFVGGATAGGGPGDLWAG